MSPLLATYGLFILVLEAFCTLTFMTDLVDKNPCSSLVSPCKNGGTCIEQGDEYSCICANDWKGKDCSDSKRESIFALMNSETFL